MCTLRQDRSFYLNDERRPDWRSNSSPGSCLAPQNTSLRLRNNGRALRLRAPRKSPWQRCIASRGALRSHRSRCTRSPLRRQWRSRNRLQEEARSRASCRHSPLPSGLALPMGSVSAEAGRSARSVQRLGLRARHVQPIDLLRSDTPDTSLRFSRSSRFPVSPRHRTSPGRAQCKVDLPGALRSVRLLRTSRARHRTVTRTSISLRRTVRIPRRYSIPGMRRVPLRKEQGEHRRATGASACVSPGVRPAAKLLAAIRHTGVDQQPPAVGRCWARRRVWVLPAVPGASGPRRAMGKCRGSIRTRPTPSTRPRCDGFSRGRGRSRCIGMTHSGAARFAPAKTSVTLETSKQHYAKWMPTRERRRLASQKAEVISWRNGHERAPTARMWTLGVHV